MWAVAAVVVVTGVAAAVYGCYYLYKSKEEEELKKAPETSAPSPPSTPQAPLPASIPVLAVPAPSPEAAPVSTAPAGSLTNVYGQAASNLVAGSSLDSTIQEILDIGGGTWGRDIVVRALRAAVNNPERAVDDLYSNEDSLLWKLGTPPPGLITFDGLTHPLEKTWHAFGLGYNPSIDRSDIEKAVVDHYNGKTVVGDSNDQVPTILD